MNIVINMPKDKVGFKTEWRIEKFRDPNGEIAKLLRGGAKVEDVINCYPEAFINQEMIKGNIALDEGLHLLAEIITGIDTTTPKWDSSNARIGVGDSDTAEQATQTGLLGTNKTFKSMDTNYPTVTDQTAEWRATFGSDEANYHWQEYTVVNASNDTGVNLNRKVADKGTKVSGETWALSLKITFS